MNEKLIELYFQIENEVADNFKEKDKIRELISELFKKFGNDSPLNMMIKREASNFCKERIHPLLEKNSEQADFDESTLIVKKECLKVLEAILGDEIEKAKQIRNELFIQRIVERNI
ncbi:hypothetical protein ACFL49_00895 [Candidatus Omnitrophota bacterium]